MCLHEHNQLLLEHPIFTLIILHSRGLKLENRSPEFLSLVYLRNSFYLLSATPSVSYRSGDAFRVVHENQGKRDSVHGAECCSRAVDGTVCLM